MALRKFLNAHKSSMNYTHLSLQPNGKYNIKDSELPLLYDLIRAETNPCHILESHSGFTCGPLLIDLDFEFPDEPRFHARQYTREQIEKFIELLNQSVIHFFGNSITDNVEFVVSEKPSPTIETGKRVKDGLHIIAKGLTLTYSDQHTLRLYALQKHFLQNAFNMDYVKNKPDSVYDKSVISTNSWYLLGCSKPDRDPYLPTIAVRIIEGELLSRSVEAACYSIADLSIRNKATPCQILSDYLSEWKAVSEPVVKPSKKSGTKQPAQIEPDSVSQHIAPASVIPFSELTGGRPAFQQSFEVLEKLVSLWSAKRTDNYAGWRNCVFCIAVCGKTCGAVEEARKLAHQYILKSRGGR